MVVVVVVGVEVGVARDAVVSGAVVAAGGAVVTAAVAFAEVVVAGVVG